MLLETVYNRGESSLLEVDNISPQEEYWALLEQIMKSCNGVVILYSISDRESFLKAVRCPINV
jgi:GTPase SAR1 family protein